MVGPGIGAHLTFSGAAGGGDDRGAEPLTDFDGGQPDAAGRAVHQQDLAPGETSLVLQPQMRGAVGDRKARGDGIVDGVRENEHAVLRRHDLFGEAAVFEHRHDTVARFAARDAGRALEDPAGHLEAGRNGSGGLI